MKPTASQVNYIYRTVDGDILVSSEYLSDKEVHDRELKLTMEAAGESELSYFIASELYKNDKVGFIEDVIGALRSELEVFGI